MSFILDALKKSENERQRHSGPALFEVKVATPRPGLPLWAVALALLLVVNIGVVIWLVLRKPASVAQTVPAAMAAIPAPAPTPIQVAQAPPPAAAPAPASQQPSAVESQAPDASAPAQSAPLAQSDDDGEPLNPDDYEPAAEPSAGAPSTHAGNVTRGTTEGLPTYDQVAAGGSVPELRLDMHVYSAKPQDRFVFLNMQRLREGESLPNGVHVERITPGGVVLSHGGTRFVLERQ
jgi:general secretion pathway protein B